MKRILPALLTFFCFSCQTVPPPDLSQKLTGNSGTLPSGKKVHLDPLFPMLKRAEWRMRRQPSTVWKAIYEVVLSDGTILQFCSATAAFRVRGMEGEFYIRAQDAGPFMKFGEERIWNAA